MMPEHIVIQMTDGTEFAAMVHVESGKLHVKAGGLIGFTFVLEPESVRQVAWKILNMVGGPSAEQVGTKEYPFRETAR